MSLVLEALKKAEAERERERAGVPGLHTPAPLPPAAGGAPRGWLPWAVAAAALAVAAGLAWRASTPPPAPAPVVSAPAAPPPASAVAPAAPVVAAAPAPAPVAETPPPPRSTAPARSAETPRAAAANPPPRPRVLADEPAPRARTTAPADNRPAAADAAVYDGVQALPEGLRRALPALNFGGAMDSDNPASRMLIVNGQVFRENDALGPDLVLERIALKSAVFRFRDVRFRVRY